MNLSFTFGVGVGNVNGINRLKNFHWYLPSWGITHNFWIRFLLQRKRAPALCRAGSALRSRPRGQGNTEVPNVGPVGQIQHMDVIYWSEQFLKNGK